jgi:glycosyltransferase involved in cell wall biosynthesis
MIHRVWSTRFGRKTALGRLADYVSFYLSAGWAALRCRDIDCLVVLSDPPLLSILGAVVGLLKGWKTVCWLQDVSPENAVRAGVLTHPWLVRPLQVVTAWSLKRATRLVVVGRCMERHLVLTGLPPKRIVLIPNWANGEQLSPVDRTQNWFRDEHGLNGHLIVMYSGNLGVVHETDALMRLIQSLEQDRNVQFVFTGYGKGKERLEEWVRREGVTNLRFIEYQAQKDLRYSLSAGDVHLVTLRTDMEGLSVPSKTYSIMAVGRPVLFIGPDGSEAALVIRDAHCGEVFPPGETEKTVSAIRTLAGEDERRAHLGASGRRYFEERLEKRMAIERFRELFRSLS